MSQDLTAIVCTLRNPGPSIRSFVQYHLRIGFHRIYLFFDDPRDAWISEVPSDDRVEILPCDDELRSCWADWPAMRAFVGTEVMARQVLNAELAIQLGRQAGIQWLLHLDADELIDFGETSVEGFFSDLGRSVEQVSFLNMEVVPEAVDVLDMFREMTLFKRNRMQIPPRVLSESARLIEAIPQIPPGWFFYYANGKSAVRLGGGLLPSGVHRFQRSDGVELRTIHVAGPRVLHYMNSGFANFWNRYETWGRFPDFWFGNLPISKSIGSFHLAARDIVATGDIGAAREFYTKHVVILDSAIADALLATGLCERVCRPSTLLSTQ